jgi:hypothetical protein
LWGLRERNSAKLEAIEADGPVEIEPPMPSAD